ncbi:MAG: hypothetical protein J7K26_00065 [Candidatus Aenigmarchaeota archaeon]|nr:hypothetical protein [Candidatus Aenigmarchaeota archaeon]
MLEELKGSGILIEPEALSKLEKMSKNDIKLVITKAKEYRPLVLTQEIIDSYIRQVNFKKIKEFEIIKKYTIDDFIKQINDRFAFLKQILVNKTQITNLISINKLSNGTKCSIIGMIKTIDSSNTELFIEVEDQTGMINCSLSKDYLDKIKFDDVIALNGYYSDNIFHVNEIMFPDVPLRVPILSSNDIIVSFSEKFNPDVKSDFTFILEDKNVNNAYFVNKPVSLFEINGINILIVIGYNALELLRKRYISINNTDFLLDVVPDIVFNESINKNYKGISIVSLNKQINLRNREIMDI